MNFESGLAKIKSWDIAVLCGGDSSEREVSLRSGRAVYEALNAQGFRARLEDVGPKNCGRLKDRRPDFAFLALHGSYGEDGALQEWLELEGISYSGSGPKACRRSMDKRLTRAAFLRGGLRCPEGIVFCREDKIINPFGAYPVFVKPASGGSSIGVSRVESEGALREAAERAFAQDRWIILERAVAGREFTAGVLGDRALPAIEIRTPRTFFDYEAKYSDSGTEYVFPEDLPEEVLKSLEAAAFKAHEILECRSFSRTDFILSEDGQVWALELNAIPGMTSKSLMPKAARRAGIGFADLCAMIILCSVDPDFSVRQWQKSRQVPLEQ